MSFAGSSIRRRLTIRRIGRTPRLPTPDSHPQLPTPNKISKLEGREWEIDDMAELKKVQPDPERRGAGGSTSTTLRRGVSGSCSPRRARACCSLSYEDAVKEALCSDGSTVSSVDRRSLPHADVPATQAEKRIVPRRTRRASPLVEAGVIAPPAWRRWRWRKSGRLEDDAEVDKMTIRRSSSARSIRVPTRRRTGLYTASAQRSFLHMVNNAKRPETPREVRPQSHRPCRQ